MAGYTGHCNCGGVKVVLKEKPDQVFVCHCANCKRAGGPFSMNFVVEDGEMDLQDGQKTLSEYLDHNTDSGNTIRRFFCKNCGSPVKTTSPSAPGKAFLKASLFDDIPTKKQHEAYTEKALHFE